MKEARNCENADKLIIRKNDALLPNLEEHQNANSALGIRQKKVTESSSLPVLRKMIYFLGTGKYPGRKMQEEACYAFTDE